MDIVQETEVSIPRIEAIISDDVIHCNQFSQEEDYLLSQKIGKNMLVSSMESDASDTPLFEGA